MKTENKVLKLYNIFQSSLINPPIFFIKFPFFLLTSWFLILSSSTLPVKAITFITERAMLAENDQLNWSSLGQIFNPFSPDPSAFLPNTFSAISTGGTGINVEIPFQSSPQITPPFVFQTSSPPFGIPTNFADGDLILFTGFNPATFPAVGNAGPITINFDSPVKGAGTQIAVDDTLQFEAFISAFDKENNLLGAFSTNGTSSLVLDNSAVFLGVKSDIPEISKLVFSSSIPQRALGINNLSISTVTVSEPSTIMAIGILGFGLFLGKKRKC
ncbi:MAG: PEP-CTERM sorting domain-containing protein [Okeania sp. SIO2C9]|uniref:PEP-CTERM sorting domain-containing protein n=1 Tax=Okeania sp. SIO2C9 TaxID=2607791 RepID=UPI0013C24DB4|nr:PEP-CTERM sorting domain-containing protein [Okeania sp. SIO2C9]NEQ71960.1 PEP-CTERM sorting domain-containing protein [Okeania sp. SIO2C9]